MLLGAKAHVKTSKLRRNPRHQGVYTHIPERSLRSATLSEIFPIDSALTPDFASPQCLFTQRLPNFTPKSKTKSRLTTTPKPKAPPQQSEAPRLTLDLTVTSSMLPPPPPHSLLDFSTRLLHQPFQTGNTQSIHKAHPKNLHTNPYHNSKTKPPTKTGDKSTSTLANPTTGVCPPNRNYPKDYNPELANVRHSRRIVLYSQRLFPHACPFIHSLHTCCYCFSALPAHFLSSQNVYCPRIQFQ